MRLSVDIQREVLRLACDPSLSNRAIGRLAKISHNTVRNIRHHLDLSGESWDSLKELDNSALVARLRTYVRSPIERKARPSWLDVHEQLKQPDVTQDLLWQEYRITEPEGLSYAQYTRLYREWLKQQKISMRQVHLAGDKCFVDFCGRTMGGCRS